MLGDFFWLFLFCGQRNGLNIQYSIFTRGDLTQFLMSALFKNLGYYTILFFYLFMYLLLSILKKIHIAERSSILLAYIGIFYWYICNISLIMEVLTTFLNLKFE